MTTPILEEPVRGHHPDLRLLALPGIEMLEAFTRGQSLPPPIHYLFGLKYEFTRQGHSRFTLPLSRWLLAPQGLVSGATLALLADGPLGCAGQSLMPAATPYTTAELSLSFIRPVLATSGVLTGDGRAVHVGRSAGMTEVQITDDSGRVVAVGSSRLFIMPPMELPPGTLEDLQANPPTPVERAYPTPHPFQRDPLGEVLDQEVFATRGGLDILAALASGELPAPPISHLLGIRPVAAAEGTSTWRMPASPWMCSPVPGRLYGGAIAYMAGTAIEGAVQTTVKAGGAFAGLDLKVYFLRPVVPDGGLMEARGTVISRGRTMAIATSEVFDSRGKKVATAVGSAMILPGRPANLAGTSEIGVS